MFLYQGAGRIPLDYARMRYCRQMQCTEADIDVMLRTAPGRFGRHLHYLELEALTPRRDKT